LGLGDPADLADAALDLAPVGQGDLDPVAGLDVGLLADVRSTVTWCRLEVTASTGPPGAAWLPRVASTVLTRADQGRNTAGMAVVKVPVWSSPRACCQRLTAALVAQV
jgi:hypothetical protein